MVQPKHRRSSLEASSGNLPAEVQDRRFVAMLVADAAAGESRATEALIQRYSGLVWSICWNYHLNGADAADVSQVVWMRLVENISRIRQPDSLGAWLSSVTRHECLRLLRRSEREFATADDFDLDENSREDDIDVAL